MLLNNISGWFYQVFLKPLLFLIDSEVIHEKMVSFGEMLGQTPITQLFDLAYNQKAKILNQKILQLNFDSPVGLSAGFDYEAKLTQILPHMGFGFETVGTITNLPYDGNHAPRLGRLPKSRSLMVNKGFKNMGVKKIINKLEHLHFTFPLGVSIGRTNGINNMTQEQSVDDVMAAFKAFENSIVKHSYYELNISCPNLYGNVSFYPKDNLYALLKKLEQLKITKPVFIKMPINNSNEEILNMLAVIVQFNISGVIFGNLQKDRKDISLDQNEVKKFKVGNFSGKPCEKRSNELIKLAYRNYGKKLIIIGCGGVFTAEDAYKKIKLGASLVQLITGMIYQGPQLISQINTELAEILKKEGYKNISEAIGIAVD